MCQDMVFKLQSVHLLEIAVGKKDELELESVVCSGLIVAVSIMTAMAIGFFAEQK